MTDARATPGDPALEREVRAAVRGEVRFDALTRGLYSTDASHYQVEPIGVVFPESTRDVQAVFEIARARGVPVLPRGGGTSQCGQTIGRAIVLDTHRSLRGIGPIEEGPDGAEIEVEPGVVLDDLNAHLASHGLWFPVDPSTGSRATLGGMAGNNSAGARSIQYGMMVDNVAALDVLLADGRTLRTGEGGTEASVIPDELAALRALYAREADEIARTRPRTMRNVAGYNLDRLDPVRENLAHLLVGSEGTLAFFSRLRLRLTPLPRRRALGVCHFPTLVDALDSVQHLVQLGPSAVELVDSNVLRLAAERADFRDAMASFVRGTPGALLLVEFATTADDVDLEGRVAELDALLADHGWPNAVVPAIAPEKQSAVWSVRKAGLNIVMSMAGARKPISFIEDCAVPLEHLAEYAQRVDAIFRRHGTEGTWYAHASVGCLHVRPALNLRDPDDVALVRTIAEETHAVVRDFGGTHSGEHGDGILRSEFLESMLGRRMADAFAEVKATLDPAGLMNPGKIVDPPRMDDRTLLRYHPEYASNHPAGSAPGALPVLLDWSASGGVLPMLEACNNNGACRKSDPGVMCPSFRVTQDERHSTRGRANALRLAVTGQLGEGGLDSPEMAEAMSLCISCKGCRRECPTGVDMARLKLEWQHRRNGLSGIRARDRVLASLPRLAPRIHRLAPLLNTAGRGRWKRAVGLAAARPLPAWSKRPWRDGEAPAPDATDAPDAPDVVLFVDTFSRWFDPAHARAAGALLSAGGWKWTAIRAAGGDRPLCCGRTWLSAGMLDQAREEAARFVERVVPLARAGAAIAGLEPSCLYTLRDEMPDLLPGDDADLVASRAVMLEDFLDREWDAGRPLPFDPGIGAMTVRVHGHCHQKAFGESSSTASMLRRLPGAEVEEIESGCCGMAGSFGYHAEHYATSLRMGELALLPAVRSADPGTRIVANGTSCRAQIQDGAGRAAVHSAVLMAEALATVR